MSLTDADKLELRAIVKEAVSEAFSRRGLGADTETEITERQADQLWVRQRRKAWEDTIKSIRRGILRGGLVGLVIVVGFAVLHPVQFAAFLGHVLGITK